MRTGETRFWHIDVLLMTKAKPTKDDYDEVEIKLRK